MEGLILNALQFNISMPLPIHFLRRYYKASGTEFKTYCLCRYVLELSLFDVQMHKFTPSQIAAAAFYLARVITKEALAWVSNWKIEISNKRSEISISKLFTKWILTTWYIDSYFSSSHAIG